MVLALLFFWQILFALQSSSQLDPPFYAPGAGEDFEAFIFENLESASMSEGERRIVARLIIEAGRHALFPDLYVDNKETEADVSSESRSDETDESNQNKGMKIFEIKGQPEVEESYMNRSPRRQRVNCPDDCPVYRPVCGTDGKVYQSECHLMRENCGTGNVTTGEWSKCRGTHYLCPSRCLDLADPVCGSDLRIYHNICIMRKRNCGKLVQKLPLTACYERYSLSVDKACPDECPPVARPVCGSNGIIYFNECFLRMRTCREGIAEVDMDNCVTIPKCPQVCVPLYDPVCGSDQNQYINLCRMLQINCGKDIKKMPSSFCSTEGQ